MNLGLSQSWKTAVERLHSPAVRLHATNTGSLMLEQLLRAGLNAVVGIYVARYLGPSQYGIFNFIIAQVTIAAALVPLGLNGILVREIVSRPDQQQLDLGTAFWAMMVGALLVSFAVFAFGEGFSFSHKGGDHHTRLYLALGLSIVLGQPFTVVNFYCLAHTKALIPASCRIIVMIFGAALKVAAIERGSPLIFFFIITAVEQAVLASSYMVASFIFRVPAFLGRFSRQRLHQMLKMAWPILMNGVAVAVHVRLGQIMVTSLSTPHEAGIFAGATRIYEAWINVPYVCVVSLLPILIRSEAQSDQLLHRRLAILMGSLLWCSFAIVGFFVLFGRSFILLTFGEAYSEIYMPLIVLMIAALGYSVSNCLNQYFIIKHREMLVTQRTAIALAVNIGAGFLLIPQFHALGAAFAALIGTFIANYMMLWLSKKDADLLRTVHQSIFFFVAKPA